MGVSVQITGLGQVIGNLQNYSQQKQIQINNRIQLAGINVQRKPREIVQ